MKIFDGLLDRLDGCHIALSQMQTENSSLHVHPLSTNSVLYEVACQLNVFIIAQEKSGRLQV